MRLGNCERIFVALRKKIEGILNINQTCCFLEWKFVIPMPTRMA